MSIVTCPHCSEFVIIEEVNCAIFRHGSYKNTGVQIDAHLNEKKCKQLSKKNLIDGCGKPFKIIFVTNKNISAVICDYI